MNDIIYKSFWSVIASVLYLAKNSIFEDRQPETVLSETTTEMLNETEGWPGSADPPNSAAADRISAFKSIVKYVLEFSPNLLSANGLMGEELNEFVFRRLTTTKLILWPIDQKTSPIPPQNLKRLKYLIIFSKYANESLLNEVTKLKNLKVLSINCLLYELQDEIWTENIKTIASNCVGLEFFQFKIFTPHSKVLNPKKCLKSISHFRGLKTLKFCLNCEQTITDLFPLINCKGLVILKLSVKFIDEDIFDGIHLIIPQLRKLSIDAFGGHKLTDNGLKSIAKLKCLTHLRLKSFELDITANGLKKLIDSCERLKYVNIFHNRITESYFGFKKRNLLKLIEHYEKYQKRVETRDEVNTKPLEGFWNLWNRMKEWTEKTDTKQRSHCIQFHYNFD